MGTGRNNEFCGARLEQGGRCKRKRGKCPYHKDPNLDASGNIGDGQTNIYIGGDLNISIEGKSSDELHHILRTLLGMKDDWEDQETTVGDSDVV
ncbi:uncharacterized protein METZ01_LOCUS221598, partial [marine metagenome]